MSTQLQDYLKKRRKDWEIPSIIQGSQNEIKTPPIKFCNQAENLCLNESLSADNSKKQKINTGTRTKGLSLFYIRSNICL